MAKQPNIYRRLPGRGVTPLQHTRLYVAPDHLLQAASTGYSESYKRFYFRDIQAVALRQTGAGKVWNAVWAALAGILALNSLALDGVARLVLLGLGGLFLLALLANVARGPTVACTIRTAVQTERLPSLKRVRQTRKVLNQLKPLIAAAQGQLPTEELAQRLDETWRRAAYEASAPPVIDERIPAPPVVSPGLGPSPKT